MRERSYAKTHNMRHERSPEAFHPLFFIHFCAQTIVFLLCCASLRSSSFLLLILWPLMLRRMRNIFSCITSSRGSVHVGENACTFIYNNKYKRVTKRKKNPSFPDELYIPVFKFPALLPFFLLICILL